jgi:hypothetical protein
MQIPCQPPLVPCHRLAHVTAIQTVLRAQVRIRLTLQQEVPLVLHSSRHTHATYTLDGDCGYYEMGRTPQDAEPSSTCLQTATLGRTAWYDRGSTSSATLSHSSSRREAKRARSSSTGSTVEANRSWRVGTGSLCLNSNTQPGLRAVRLPQHLPEDRTVDHPNHLVPPAHGKLSPVGLQGPLPRLAEHSTRRTLLALQPCSSTQRPAEPAEPPWPRAPRPTAWQRRRVAPLPPPTPRKARFQTHRGQVGHVAPRADDQLHAEPLRNLVQGPNQSPFLSRGPACL